MKYINDILELFKQNIEKKMKTGISMGIANVLCVLLIGLFMQKGFAQNFDKVKLDKYFETLGNNNKFMGSVAVSKNGEIIYKKSIGFADVEKNIEATDKTKYKIGSISKTFTAVLVLKAMEEEKLDLKQTIDKWFPSIINADKITVEQLLAHSSGVRDFTKRVDYLTWHTQPKTEQDMVDIISGCGSDFNPNQLNS